MKKLYIASDHAGFELKYALIKFLKEHELGSAAKLTWLQTLSEFHDFGPDQSNPVDYPDYADKVAKIVNNSPHSAVGVLICGSGQGMCMRANRYPQVRAALGYNDTIVELARSHNDANILCLGGRFCQINQVIRWLELFLTTPFADGRHSIRVHKLSRFDKDP